MLHVIYRSYGGENKKGRPDYYSKLLSLMSFVRCFQQLEPDAAEVIFLNDGPIPSDRLRVMEQSGEVMARSKMGNSGSVRTALEIPSLRSWPDDDLVWLAEDDYLYLPHALTNLLAAARSFPEAAYFGLYALIGSRQPDGTLCEDRIPQNWSDSETTFVHGHPWRRALSTTSTFGARVGSLIDDRLMMQIAMKSGGAWDHTICLMYNGFAPYPMASLIDGFRNPAASKSWLRRAGVFGARLGLDFYQTVRAGKGCSRRQLVAADPALITHVESAYLALGTDWRSVALSTREWMESSACVAEVHPVA